MRSCRLSKSRITAGLQCGRRLWLSVHRPELQIYGADAQRRFASGDGVGLTAPNWLPTAQIPWDDADFSRRMLAEHLSQDHALASRRTEWIDRQAARGERENGVIGRAECYFFLTTARHPFGSCIVGRYSAGTRPSSSWIFVATGLAARP